MEEPFSKEIDDKDIKGKDIQQNKCLSFKTVVALLTIIGILVIGVVVLVLIIVLKDDDDKKTERPITPTPEEEEKPMEGRKILFQQPKETERAKHIIVHIPEKEIFMSTLHPAASLYEDVTDDVKVKQCFDDLKSILKEKNIELITVRSALKLNKTALKKLASDALVYHYDDEEAKKYEKYEEFKKIVTDEYKEEVLNKLSEEQLVDVVLNNPRYELRPTDSNTFIEPTSISFSPLGNLVFCRDQQITTRKGVVIGRARSSQRAGEHKIMEQVFKNINATIVGNAKEGGENSFLEGGDYFVAKNDLSMLGVGLRTTMDGAKYLMENDLLGTQFMAIVYDDEDLDQQRMHLDTYFNMLSDKHVIVLNFTECEEKYKKKVNRKVFLFEQNAKNPISEDEVVVNETNIADIPKVVGNYKLISVYQKFYDFLDDHGYTRILVSDQQQIDYMINFLNIGNNEILSVNEKLGEVAKDANVKVKFVEFRPILNMYGAMHCITQVSRVE